MPFTWTPELCLSLALTIVAAADVRPSTQTWEIVAQQLSPEGQISASACSQKFYKLKKESEALLAGPGTSNIPATPSTAKKGRQPKTPNTGNGTGKKRGRANPNNGDGDSQEDDSPAKKARVKKEAAKKGGVKKEDNTAKEVIEVDDESEAAEDTNGHLKAEGDDDAAEDAIMSEDGDEVAV